MKYYSLVTLLSLCFYVSLKAQNTDPLKASLDEQFEHVFQKSQKYQNYKVVSINNFNHLKKSSLDTLKFYKQDSKSLILKIDEVTNQVDVLHKELQLKNQEIKGLLEAQKSVSFLGVNINKNLFSVVILSVVGGLLLLLVLFIMKFKSAKSQANDAVDRLSRVEDEYVEYKRKSMEKEQQLGRKLQDEINKNRKD